ncbi:MAG: hypothetical protein EB127_05860 [Alphaproteobacteria bacterium]|nr:hypothetical protein [Alphaproteobacteria bacterium]
MDRKPSSQVLKAAGIGSKNRRLKKGGERERKNVFWLLQSFEALLIVSKLFVLIHQDALIEGSAF